MVPVLMTWPRNVSLSTMATARRGSVKVWPHSIEVGVGGADGGCPFFPGGDDLEEQLRSVGIELGVAHSVDYADIRVLDEFERIGALVHGAHMGCDALAVGEDLDECRPDPHTDTPPA